MQVSVFSPDGVCRYGEGEKSEDALFSEAGKGVDLMNVLWYIAVCGAFFGGSMLIEKNREVKELKRELERIPEEQKITRRNFRSFTV